MTKQEFENLKVGDIVKRSNTDGTTLHKIKVASLNYHITEIIDPGNKKSNFFNKGSEYVFYSEFSHLYELITSKPKKLYKPWG